MSITDGIPGLEATHTCNSLTMNNLATTPRIRLERITGLHSLSEIEDQRTDSGGSDWEIPLPTPRKGKTVVYEGQVQSSSLSGLRQTSRAMRAAFAERSAEQVFYVGSSPQWWYRARIMQFDEDDEWYGTIHDVFPFSRKFTLGLRMSDGRVYTNPQQSVSGTPGQVIAVTNSGITDTPPRFVIAVPSDHSVVHILNNTLSKDLYFTDVPQGTLTVDFKYHTALVGSVDVGGHILTSGATWWDEGVPELVPGQNLVTVNGANWTMYWYHADE